MRVTWQWLHSGNTFASPERVLHSPFRQSWSLLAIDVTYHDTLIYNQMVVEKVSFVPPSDDEVNRIFRALADATRRDIIRRTLCAPVNVSQLASEYEMSFAAVQKHVSVLEGAGLVTKKQQGRERLVHANPRTLQHVHNLLQTYEHIWHTRVAQLDAFLEEELADGEHL